MKLKISVPNDHNSVYDMVRAVADCYDGDDDAAAADEGRALYDALSTAALEAGLRFVETTDFGAVWDGTPEQCARAQELLPAWAYVGEAE